MNLSETIHPALAGALTARGYDALTPVQLAVLEPGRSEADLLVSAQTGSGKTVAFGMAIARTLLGEVERFEAPSSPLALVVAPTRELALQVQRELDWLFAPTGASIASCVGGMDQRTERRALERGAHIVVGTPGRLRDHITRGALDLASLRAVVLDEADEMLDLGFREDLEFILAAAPEDRRTLMFSATVPKAIAQLATRFQRDAVRVSANAVTERHADIEYQLMLVAAHEREHAIINTLLYFDSSNTIVFCHTREAVKHLTARLANRGFSVVALSGELTQAERTNALQSMRDGRARVCVATDVAARGIDLPNLDLVVHADLPSNPDTLLHRSGRTGRAGRKGVCVLVVPAHRRGAAARVLKLANLEAVTRAAPGIAEIEARHRQQLLDALEAVQPPDVAEAPFVEELLARLSPERLAAAYLRQHFAARPAPEELTEIEVQALPGRALRSDRSTDAAGPREPRQPDMADGVWFTLSLGRKHRADPKWLLPMICKAGDVTKRDVGSIKIDDTETRFEIAAGKAEAFAAATAQRGALEKGVVIRRAGEGAGSAPAVRRDATATRPRPAARPHRETRDSAASERPRAPRLKVRTDDGRKLAGEPDFGPAPAARPKAPRKPDPKDKGKPKYKNRKPRADDVDAGAAPRKVRKPGYDPLG